MPATIDMVAELIGLVALNWRDGVIGAHHGTHTAPDTPVGRIGLLADAVKYRE
jgi:hypothetical protein